MAHFITGEIVMAKWDELASETAIKTTIENLAKNGITVYLVKDGLEAKSKVMELIPKGSEVMTMTSQTQNAVGSTKELNESGNYKPIRSILMDKTADPKLKRQLGAAPDFTTGSMQAITEKGDLLFASQSGSQLPAYAFSAGKVIWVAGTQKIVKDVQEGMRRIYEYVLPLESERAMKAYGVTSNVSNLLIISKESKQGRLHLILVNEKLGF
jgi:outer membrane protein assembly factor BamB